MDVLRKELNEIYESQHLYMEALAEKDVRECIDKAKTYAELSGCCVVITDAALDRSFFLPGNVGCLLQLCESEMVPKKLSSSDEDFLYARMHPEDLVDLRMLEYKFFKMVDKLPTDKKLDYQAYATVRMFTLDGTYVCINKGTRVMRLSPAGKMWLILCTYDVVTHPTDVHHTHPIIVNNKTGEVQRFSFKLRPSAAQPRKPASGARQHRAVRQGERAHFDTYVYPPFRRRPARMRGIHRPGRPADRTRPARLPRRTGRVRLP